MEVDHLGNLLCNIEHQTPDICLAAVRQSGLALQLVNAQTTEISLAAVQQCGIDLAYVKNQTSEICLAAVLCDGVCTEIRERADRRYLSCSGAAERKGSEVCGG